MAIRFAGHSLGGVVVLSEPERELTDGSLCCSCDARRLVVAQSLMTRFFFARKGVTKFQLDFRRWPCVGSQPSRCACIKRMNAENKFVVGHGRGCSR